MEETGALREPTHESFLRRDNGRISDAEALRTVILVIGFILLIPGLIHLVIGFAAVVTIPDVSPEHYRTYVWTANIIGTASTAGAVVVGYLLLRIARKRPVYSVGELLYPAVTAIGAYLVLLAAVQVLSPMVFRYVILGDFDLYAPFQAATMVLYELPLFIGGLLLIMIGRHQYPVRR